MAYMVMGEGGEMTPVTPQPSTQVVAIDNGDGTQQFAILIPSDRTPLVPAAGPNEEVVDVVLPFGPVPLSTTAAKELVGDELEIERSSARAQLKDVG